MSIVPSWYLVVTFLQITPNKIALPHPVRYWCFYEFEVWPKFLLTRLLCCMQFRLIHDISKSMILVCQITGNSTVCSTVFFWLTTTKKKSKLPLWEESISKCFWCYLGGLLSPGVHPMKYTDSSHFIVFRCGSNNSNSMEFFSALFPMPIKWTLIGLIFMWYILKTIIISAHIIWIFLEIFA